MKATIAALVRGKILALNGYMVTGLSKSPGCGEVFVDKEEIKTSVLTDSVTLVKVKTPAGPRFFEVHFKETY